MFNIMLSNGKIYHTNSRENAYITGKSYIESLPAERAEIIEWLQEFENSERMGLVLLCVTLLFLLRLIKKIRVV